MPDVLARSESFDKDNELSSISQVFRQEENKFLDTLHQEIVSERTKLRKAPSTA